MSFCIWPRVEEKWERCVDTSTLPVFEPAELFVLSLADPAATAEDSGKGVSTLPVFDHTELGRFGHDGKSQWDMERVIRCGSICQHRLASVNVCIEPVLCHTRHQHQL